MIMLSRLIQYIKGILPQSGPQLSFKCHIGGYYTSIPIEPARKVFPEWLKSQVKDKNVKFVKCPGMFDIAHTGYILRAWADIHIKANSHGVMAKLDGAPGHEAEGPLKPGPMDANMVEGLPPYRGKVKHAVVKCPSPWAIFSKRGYSAYVLPATMHSPFLDKLYVYPGVVDYEDFHTINFIFTALEECEFVIPAGTPLLQIIPFKVEDYHCHYGKATTREMDKHHSAMFSRVANFYRKTLHKRKTFTIEENSK